MCSCTPTTRTTSPWLPRLRLIFARATATSVTHDHTQAMTMACWIHPHSSSRHLVSSCSRVPLKTVRTMHRRLLLTESFVALTHNLQGNPNSTLLHLSVRTLLICDPKRHSLTPVYHTPHRAQPVLSSCVRVYSSGFPPSSMRVRNDDALHPLRLRVSSHSCARPHRISRRSLRTDRRVLSSHRSAAVHSLPTPAHSVRRLQYTRAGQLALRVSRLALQFQAHKLTLSTEPSCMVARHLVAAWWSTLSSASSSCAIATHSSRQRTRRTLLVVCIVSSSNGCCAAIPPNEYPRMPAANPC